MWVGIDISRSMLNVARENETKGDLIWGDIGQGLSFRPGTFDYAIRYLYNDYIKVYLLFSGYVMPKNQATIHIKG